MKRDPAELERRRFDLVVVGGGIYGAFVAWDAALRGLSVALVEQGDFGGATSSSTLGILHGGLRYLARLEWARARRLIGEQRAFVRIAPHLAQPLPFLLPAYGRGRRGRTALAIGARLNGWVGKGPALTPHGPWPVAQTVSRTTCLQRFPALPADGLTGGVLYHEGGVSRPARLVLAVIRSAVEAGAVVANYLQAESLRVEQGQVVGLLAKDAQSGQAFEVRARAVVNACGPWLNRLLRPHGCAIAAPWSKAFNLRVGRRLVSDGAVGVFARAQGRLRALCILPQGAGALVGTAHVPFQSEHGPPSELEVQGFLNELNQACPALHLREEEVQAVHWGGVPGASTAASAGEFNSREGVVDHGTTGGLRGLISVSGAKFTEARWAAQGVVDAVFAALARKRAPCRTAGVPLAGGDMADWQGFISQARLERPAAVEEGSWDALLEQHGAGYGDVLKCIREGEAMGGGLSALERAEVRYAVRAEMALRLGDVVWRRTDLGREGAHPARLRAAAQEMAAELGWDRAQIEQEVQAASTDFALMQRG